jgi:hypothetical protein
MTSPGRPTRRRALLLTAAAGAAAVALTATLMPTGSRFGEDTCREAAPTAPATPTDRVPLGFSPGFGILTADLDDVRSDLDAMVELGVTRLRVDVSWATLQPEPDRFDWSSTDRVLGEARARGIDVLAVIGYLPGWAQRTDAEGEPLPADPEGFATFVEAAATRYRDHVGAWEIWNEPNTRRFWGAAPDPAAYAALVEAAAPRIRDADPGTEVVVGSIAPADDGPAELSPATFVTGLYDHLDPALFDAISVHPYSYPAYATGRQSWNTFFRLHELHDIMARSGDGETLIWLTEYGAPTGTADNAVSEREQADMLTVGVEEARRRCYTGPLYVYSLRDAGTDAADPEDNFGVLRADRAPKPAYAALAALLSPGDPADPGTEG